MPQIPRLPRKQKRRLIRRTYHEEVIPRVDTVAVKARLRTILARFTVPGICIVLVAAVSIVFAQVLDHQFIDLGDKAAVYGNPVVTSVTSGFQPGVLRHVFTHIDHDSAGFYAPLTTISHMIDWRLYNQLDDRSAGGHHLVNLLLHGTTVLLLFLTLRFITGAIWRSAFVAALFAVHPLQVESVSWVAQRGDLLCGLFFILAIDAYVRYVYRPWSMARYLAVFALFILGMLSKPAMVSLPFVLLLLDYWPLGRYTQPAFAGKNGPARQDTPSVFLRLLTEKIPFFAVSLLDWLITLHAQAKIKTSLDTFSYSSQIKNLLFACIAYIKRTFLPKGITVFYPQSTQHKGFFEVCLALGLLAVISATAFSLRKKCPYLFVGWFWFLGMLAPAIGWGAGGLYAGADFFGYLPLIGIYIVIAWLFWDLSAVLPRRAWIATAIAVLGMAGLIVRARAQCGLWQNGVTLWTHALETTNGNYIAYDNLGKALVEKDNLDQAIGLYEDSLAIRPGCAEAQDDLGNAYLQKGKFDDAMSHYREALDLRPKFAEACIDLGGALVARGRLDGAIQYYKRALEIRPDYADAHYNLGRAYAQAGDLEDAISEFKQALSLRPYFSEACYNLGLALCQSGPLENLPEAISEFQKALKIRPGYLEAYFELGYALFRTGDLAGAIANWEKAIAIRPNYAQAHSNLALALVDEGRFDEALTHYQKALEIGANYAEIYCNMGTALVMKKEFKDAIGYYEKAIEIDPGFLLAKNDLAWQLATCPISSLRDGKRAIELIQKESDLAGDRDPILLRTLAAAYAETGRFPDAVQSAQRALRGFNPKANPPLVEELQHELKLYEAGSPYHGIQ